MLVRIFANMQRRDVDREFDRLLIIANSCNYANRFVLQEMSAKIKLDVSLLTDDDIKHLTVEFTRLKSLLGATEVYTCVCLPVKRHCILIEADNSAGRPPNIATQPLFEVEG